ncbi:MAG: caspase family protein [Alphaproteobacteria bacterium]|nr:caspase family protein [Alphaproteobacteria bacterium]
MRVSAMLATVLMTATVPADAGADTVPVPTPRPLLASVLNTAARDASVPDGSGRPTRNRDSIAVIIGNRNYGNGLPPVIYADNDAASIRRFVIDVLGYREGNVIDLRDATQAHMNSVFGNAREHRGKLWSWIRSERSDVLVYYSGHGLPGLRDKRGYLVPVDADPATPEINGYALDLLLANLAKLETRSTTVLLDACFSGNSAGGWLIPSASPVYLKTAPSPRAAGMTVIAAAQDDQVASWDHEAKLGLFTRHLLAGLYGAADKGPGGNGDGTITLDEIESHLDDEMSYAARRLFQRVQTASVSGDPGVLLASVPARSFASPAPRPAARPVSPATSRSTTPSRPVVDVAALSQNRAVSPVGGFHRPGRNPEAVHAFLARHRADIVETLRAHYANAPGHGGRPSFRLLDMRVVAIRGHGFDLYVRYADQSLPRTGGSHFLFRVRVTSKQLIVEKMWR